MSLLRAKIILPVSIVLVVGVLLTAYLFWINRPAHYFIIIEGPMSLSEGSPVMVEKVTAGSVDFTGYDTGEGNRHVARFVLPRDFSIPVNSVIRVVYPDSMEGGYIEIDVMASRDYHQPGDTVFRGAPIVIEGEARYTDDAKPPGEGLVYKVQLMVSSSRIDLDSKYFGGLEPIEETSDNGVYKYYTGNEQSLSAIKKLQAVAVKKGIPDAFVVPFYHGERISIREAVNYEK